MKKTASTFILLLIFASLFSQKSYRGGEVFSNAKVLYGKFEMRMKMIKGSGMLSTFYTIRNSDTYWAELDIEVLGKENAEIMSTNIHTRNSSGNLVNTPKEIHFDSSLADDFHTYIVEWTPDYVAWYIDGIEYRRVTEDVVDVLNLAQGYRFNAWISSTPAWVGSIDKNAMPCYQYIDWIEYSSYNASSEDFTFAWRDDFNTFNTSRWSKAEWTFDGNEVDFVKENVFIEDGKLVLAITDPNPVGISEKPIQNDFTAKYSSVSNEVEICCFEEGNYKTQLYDISGKILLSKQFNTPSFSLSCSNIQSGLYIIGVNNRGVWSRRKVFIE